MTSYFHSYNIYCNRCGATFKLKKDEIYAGHTYCEKCNNRIKLDEDIDEDKPTDYDYCESCNNLVPINELSLGYMLCDGEKSSTGIITTEGYELARLCRVCKAFDPVM